MGWGVTLLDVGHERPAPVDPDRSFLELRESLADPLAYFLGRDSEAVVYPGSRDTYYGFPPSKSHVFRPVAGFRSDFRGIHPSLSFARGGLAEAWTAGAYEYNDHDLHAFPISHADLAPHYDEVAARIGIGAEEDDLARFIPMGDAYLPALDPDRHSALLLERYARHRETLNRRHRFFLGRSRVAALSRNHGGRRGCASLGRCLWGCPTEAIYSPFYTLRECMTHPRFEYVPGVLVRHFEAGESGRVEHVVARRLDNREDIRLSCDRLVLAAGAVATSKIVMDSIYRRSGTIPVLEGLMDNRQVHVPFLTPSLMGTEVETAAYQFHHIAFGVERDDPQAYVHGQITTLRAASIHPIVQNLPLDLRSAIACFQRIRGGLAVANINLHDTRRRDSHATIRPTGDEEDTQLILDYADAPSEEVNMHQAIRDVKRALRRLGCFIPPGMTRVLPKGTSAHYTGTLPMTATRRPLASAPDGRSWDFDNLYLVDGAVFPFLPAKNHTFTLMANAVRVARTTLAR
jgi:choline dehydrogenase-like flavoprotein